MSFRREIYEQIFWIMDMKVFVCFITFVISNFTATFDSYCYLAMSVVISPHAKEDAQFFLPLRVDCLVHATA